MSLLLTNGKNITEKYKDFKEGMALFTSHGFSTKVEELILPYLTYRWEESNEFCGPFFRNFKKLLDMYKVMDMSVSDVPGNSTLTVPIVYWIMNSIGAKVASSITAASPYVQFIPQNTVSDDLARAGELAVQFMMIKSNFEAVADKFGFSTGLYGKGWLATTVDSKTKLPYIYSPSIFDVRPDPYYPSVRDGMRFVFEERRVTRDIVEELQEQGIFYKGDISDPASRDTEKSQMNAKGTDTIKQNTTDNEVIYIDRYISPTHIILIANNSKILQIKKNPLNRITMDDANWNEIEGELFVLGPIEASRNLVKEFCITRNQSLIFKNLIMAGMWKSPKGNCDEDTIKVELGKIIECQDPSQLVPLHERLINILQYVGETEATIMNNIQSTTSVHDLMLGQGTDRRETATTSTLMSKGMNNVFDRRIKRWEGTTIADQCKCLWQLFYYITPIDRKIKISEKMAELTINPDDIGKDCDIYPLGSTVYDETNKELQRNQVVQAMNVAVARPETLSYVMFGELLEQFIETFNWKSKRRFIRTEEEQKAYLAEISVAEAMKAQIAKGEGANGNNAGANNMMQPGGQNNIGDMNKVAKG